MSLKLTVKPLKGDNFEVEAEPQATVETLKKLIAEKRPEFPPDLQKLIYSGRILKDDGIVGEIGVKPGEFIVVMAAKAKAPAASTLAPAATPAADPSAATLGATEPSATPAGGDAAAAAAANLVTGSGMESTIKQLCDMGFEREQVEKCLMAAFNNPDRAVEYLMSGIPEGIMQEQAAPPAAAPGAGGAGADAGATPAAPAPAGGGGATPFPSMAGVGGGGGGGGGATAIPPELQELRNNPQFAQLAGMLAQNPQMMAQMLPALAQSNPELVQVIQQNPQAFMQLIEEAAGGGGAQDPVAAMLAAAGQGGAGGGGGGGGPGPTVIQLTEEERAAVDRLAALGFDRNMAAQAYLACDKNEELAANFLFDSGNDMAD